MDEKTASSPEREPPAGGLRAITSSLAHVARGGFLRPTAALVRINQEFGFQCPGCAWPETPDRFSVDFCENGAKHVAHEATSKRVDREFFAAWPVAKLLAQADRWLESQGRLVEPMIRRSGSERYDPISWDEAFARIAEHLRALASPNEAVFYTSGRTSNEAAFLYQLFVREFGTNNLPDCSNMCHESSGTALGSTIGSGKGTVSLDDFEHADLIFVFGQNPGTNHPRMMTALQAAKRRGAKIVAVNPLRERALVRFTHPQDVLHILGQGTQIADLYLQVRVGGDVALLKGVMKEIFALEAASPGKILDWSFIRSHTENFEALRPALESTNFEELVEASGIPRVDMRRVADLYAGARAVIACWAMGLTQHKHGVGNVREIVNLLLLRGNLGKPGAGACPVRGHSNVQGDRTMGIHERPKPAFLDRLRDEFGFEPPSAYGFDTVDAIRAMHDGRAHVFFAMGGNFARATPDTAYVETALGRCRLTVSVATTLNRSHLAGGGEAILLPCLGRTERDAQASGHQFVSVEDSMSVVGRSQGHLKPASPHLRSEPAIVAGLAQALFGGRSRVPWQSLVDDYDRIRDRIARVIPGFEDFNRRILERGGFVLPSGARTRAFETTSGRAKFSVVPLPRSEIQAGELVLMTIRSHDQFNTTIYGDDDRYRGLSGNRRVVLVHPDDIAAAHLRSGDLVDVISHFAGQTRSVRGFTVLPYDVPKGCAAAYFPEANPLVPLDSFADESRTPTYKSVRVTLARSA